jgi:hypothetical protein
LDQLSENRFRKYLGVWVTESDCDVVVDVYAQSMEAKEKDHPT